MKLIGHHWGPDRLELADQFSAILEYLVSLLYTNTHELSYNEIFREYAELLGISPDETNIIDLIE